MFWEVFMVLIDNSGITLYYLSNIFLEKRFLIILVYSFYYLTNWLYSIFSNNCDKIVFSDWFSRSELLYEIFSISL